MAIETRWRHAGAQTPPHTPVSAFILATEQMLTNAVTEACQEYGLDHPITNALRDMNSEAYELRLKVINA